MKRKIIFRYIVLPLLVLLGAAAFYIYKEYNRTHKDTSKLKADYSLTAASLLKEFETNAELSGKKYWDKVLRVEGTVKDLVKDENGFYSISLGDTASASAVRCSVDSSHSHEAAVLQKGTATVVKGICTGYNADELLGSDVILVRAVVDNKK